MIPGRPANTTRNLGKSQGFLGLPISDTHLDDGTPCMISLWSPTPHELDALVRGAPVRLIVIGVEHPPVIVDVGSLPTLD